MQLPEARFGSPLRGGLGAERPSWLRGHGWGLGAEGLRAPNPASPRRRTRGEWVSGTGDPQQSSRAAVSQSKSNSNHSKSFVQKEYLYLINEKSWKNIINFLGYNDVKEVGKTNKMFNQISKQEDILIKFFKRRNKTLQLKQSSVFTGDNTFYSDNQQNESLNNNNRLSQPITKDTVKVLQKFIKIPSFSRRRDSISV